VSAGQRHGIVTAGTWCVDRNKVIDAWPAEDTVAEIHRIEAAGGGSACNLACDIKRLDPSLPVETIGLVGEDEDGRLLMRQADAFGVDRRQLRAIAGVATHAVDAYCALSSGLRTHISHAGASALLEPMHFDFGATSGRILHLGLPGVHRMLDAPTDGDRNGWVTVLRKARAAGILTNLELASIAPKRLFDLARPCLPHLDFLIVNDVEIGAIAGIETAKHGAADIHACVEAANRSMALGAMGLAVVHFPAGAVAVTRSGAVVEHASVRVPPSEIAGANGAGDAFAAGMLYGLHQGWELDRGLALAHAAAAASLRGLSTSESVEPWQACLALADRWGWRTPQESLPPPQLSRP